MDCVEVLDDGLKLGFKPVDNKDTLTTGHAHDKHTINTLETHITCTIAGILTGCNVRTYVSTPTVFTSIVQHYIHIRTCM